MQIKNSPVHKLAQEKKITIYHPENFNSSKIIDEFKKIKSDIVVVMGYGLILPKKILNIPTYGFINIHLSLLPRWRGAAPIEHAILHGDKITGVSIFQIEQKLDSGPIISSKSVKIKNNYSKDKLTKLLNEAGSNLLNLSLPKIFEKKILFKNQDNSKATYAAKITSELRKINFNQKVDDVYNHIRAFSPKPSAWFFFENKRINIIKCSKQICNSKKSTILNKEFHIGCNDGKIIPEIIQKEGKKPMDIKEFLRGFNFSIDQKVND
jgi:methionyl-tRNA formyltransferase